MAAADVSKRWRAANYTESEKGLFADIFEKFKSVLENKRTDAVTRKEKAEGWLKFHEEFNSLSTGQHRTLENLKNLWDNLKRDARKANSHQRVETLKTGGGTRDGKGDPTSTDMKVLEIIGPSGVGLECVFGGDATGADSASFMLNYTSFASNSGDDVISTVESLPLSIETQNAIKVLAWVPLSKSRESVKEPSSGNWGEYIPKMLYEKKSPPLRVGNNTDTSTPSNSSPDLGSVRKRSITEEQEWLKTCKRRRPTLPDNPTAEKLMAAKIELAQMSKAKLEEENQRKKEMFEIEKAQKNLETRMMELQLKKLERELGE